MSEPSSASTSQRDAVRAAAEAVKQALDRHLAAVEARSGEQDLTVQDAYDALHDLAADYDDLLFETYDEVTPFAFIQPEDVPAAGAAGAPGDPEPDRVTLLARWDLDVTEPDVLLEAGREAVREELRGDEVAEAVADGVEAQVTSTSRAIYQVLHAGGLAGLVERAEDLGLRPRGATTWVLESDRSEGDWMAAPFAGVDEARLVYRFDEVWET